MKNELDEEKVNLIKISNEKQRLEEHLHLLNDKTSVIRRNSEPKKDDNLKKEKVILEALSTKASFLEVISIHSLSIYHLKSKKILKYCQL